MLMSTTTTEMTMHPVCSRALLMHGALSRPSVVVVKTEQKEKKEGHQEVRERVVSVMIVKGPRPDCRTLHPSVMVVRVVLVV